MTSESRVQSEVRLAYAARGYTLWRNNSIALRDEHGRLVRAGLANESAALNARIKSSDLIGWRPVVITADMIGQTIAQFVSIECKRPGWHLTPGDQRGQAQARWGALVERDGGEFRFVTGVD